MPEIITTERLQKRVEEVLEGMVESKGEGWEKWPNFNLKNGVFVEFDLYGGNSLYRHSATGVNINIRRIGLHRSKKYMRLKYDTKVENGIYVNYVKFDPKKLLAKVSEMEADIKRKRELDKSYKQRQLEMGAKAAKLFTNHIIDDGFHPEPIGVISVTGSNYRYEGRDLTIRGSIAEDPSWVHVDMAVSVSLAELDNFMTEMQKLVDDRKGEQK